MVYFKKINILQSGNRIKYTNTKNFAEEALTEKARTVIQSLSFFGTGLLTSDFTIILFIQQEIQRENEKNSIKLDTQVT